MSYIINGPTQIGDTAALNEILGDLQLSDVCTATGDLIYSSNAAGLMTRLAIGSSGQVLTVSGGVPVWSSFTTTETGFSARKSGTQGPISAPFTDTTITTWSTATQPEFDTTAGDFNSTTGVYTTSSAGTVDVRAGVSMTSTSNSALRSASLVYNLAGTPQYFTATHQPSANNSIPLFFNIAATMLLSIGDTVEVTVSSTAATGSSTVLASPDTWFSVTKNFTP